MWSRLFSTCHQYFHLNNGKVAGACGQSQRWPSRARCGCRSSFNARAVCWLLSNTSSLLLAVAIIHRENFGKKKNNTFFVISSNILVPPIPTSPPLCSEWWLPFRVLIVNSHGNDSTDLQSQNSAVPLIRLKGLFFVYSPDRPGQFKPPGTTKHENIMIR